MDDPVTTLRQQLDEVKVRVMDKTTTLPYDVVKRTLEAKLAMYQDIAERCLTEDNDDLFYCTEIILNAMAVVEQMIEIIDSEPMPFVKAYDNDNLYSDVILYHIGLRSASKVIAANCIESMLLKLFQLEGKL